MSEFWPFLNSPKGLTSDGQVDEAKELDKLLVKDDGRLIIIQNNHDNRFILRNYLKDGKKPEEDVIKTIADNNLSQAIKDCDKFVNTHAELNCWEKVIR